MRRTRQMSVTLPVEMAHMVKSKVSSGEYASESEVIRDGLRTLEARDRALEAWLRSDVAAAYDEAAADPASVVSAEDARAFIAGLRKAAD